MSAADSSKTYLSKNLRYLRKKLKISQEKLSSDLSITRNKIASYESRNIEPKLDLISEIADYFKIRIDDLIKTRITDDNYLSLIKSDSPQYKAQPEAVELIINLDKKNALKNFISENIKIGKIINGFKAFQEIRKENDLEAKEIAQLMEVMDYLMETNKNLIMEINSTIEQIKD